MERLVGYDDDLTGLYHKARYEFAKNYCKGKNVIDVACGSGEGTEILGTVAKNVRGIDPYISLEDPEGLVTNGYIETLQASSCDVIVCFETIEHTISIDLSVQMLASALTRGGMLVLSFPNRWGETEYHFHDTNKTILSTVERCFIIDDVYGQNRKTCIDPARIKAEDADKYENIIITAKKRVNISGELSYEERFSLIYFECLRRQREKTRNIGFKFKVLPARIRTKWKRTFGV